ncbi:hypothetical protein KGA66_03050 [Actinocrinis puniceicyclus]|uniref:Uncharacterized protein n=1 Tax=Actinocrinis puniceicyclus TaxID=977794 RepID=A0A8J7WM37_9ACTN|nr:hypothetical protein [Actinocrinis puniceicyclus]MBS2962010.1 hypothetical protein [Actinocrinis puniceicyclus]
MSDEPIEPADEERHPAAPHDAAEPAAAKADQPSNSNSAESAPPDQQSTAEREEAERVEQFRSAQESLFAEEDADVRSARRERRAAAGNFRSVRSESYTEIGHAVIEEAYFGGGAARRPATAQGPVPADELRELCEVFARTPRHDVLLSELRRRRILVLHGQQGTGRQSTALFLLSELTGGKVHRLEPTADLAQLTAKSVAQNVGYLLEPATNGTAPETTVMHLDRLAALAAECGAHFVLVVEAVGATEALARSRYGFANPDAPTADVIDRHLRHLLAAESEQARNLIRAEARDPRALDALGLEELRPGEAAQLAELLASRHRAQITGDQLLAGCRTFVPDLVRSWFADLEGRPDARRNLAALRAAAFRIALAVYNSASYDVVAEAAELLAWELALTADPEAAPGRPLADDDLATRLAGARARMGTGTEQLAQCAVPVRTAAFQGERLSGAVLVHVWERHHNLRGPILRWLRLLGQERRTVIWMRAAVAAGLLASRDLPYACHELIAPMGSAQSARSQLFAATALDQAAKDETARPAVRSLVREWGRNGPPAARATAAFVHGYGRVAGSVSDSMRELRRIGTAHKGRYTAVASYNVVQLLGAAEPATVLGLLVGWLGESRREVVDLALVSVLRMAVSRTGDVWDEEVAPGLAPHEKWPLALGLVAADPALTEPLADAVWAALRTGRSTAAATKAVGGWMRRAGRDEALADALVGFLPQLINDQDDLDRLAHLVDELYQDPDDPLAAPVTDRLDDTLRQEREKI